MIIHPEVIVTPDRPTVMFREPREKIDLPKTLSQVLTAQGWGLGTYFHVQFIDHGRTRLLSMGEFVVTAVDEELQTSEANPYQPMTKGVILRKCVQLGSWWHAPGTQALEVKWNLGRKGYEIRAGDDVLAVVGDKEQAERIASGAEPLPGKAA